MAELIHGRASTYNNYKCRCDECRKAWADYIREGGYVRRYQEKKRREKLTKKQAHDILSENTAKDINLSMKVMDLINEKEQREFLEALKKYGVPTTEGETS